MRDADECRYAVLSPGVGPVFYAGRGSEGRTPTLSQTDLSVQYVLNLSSTGCATWPEASRKWCEVIARLPIFAPRSSPERPKNAVPRHAR